jgi:hypothetical protein
MMHVMEDLMKEDMEYFGNRMRCDCTYDKSKIKAPRPSVISLCESCCCMTRTLVHEDGSGLFCGKCGANKEK